MIDGVITREVNRFEDDRGWLSEVYRDDESGDYRPAMSYISFTKPGITRGPHEHKKQSDLFAFIGPGEFEVYLWDRRENSSTKGEFMKINAGEKSPKTVIVPPGVVHGYKCVSATDGMCVNLPDRLYKGEGKKEEVDEIRWESDPASPYKIE